VVLVGATIKTVYSALKLVADSRLPLSLVHEQIAKWLNIDGSECTLAKRVKVSVDYDIVDTQQTLDTCAHVMAVCKVNVDYCIRFAFSISVSCQTWSPIKMW
jgi:hypothetical protein